MDQTKVILRNTPYTVYLGNAAQDLDPDSTILQIICPELTPHVTNGSVNPGITKGSSSLKDRDGNSIGSTFTTANHLVATWEGSSNQRYAPLVRKGEAVEVYQVGEQDKFLWRPTGRGRDFRTTDRVHVEIPAVNPGKKGVAIDDTNSYSLYADSQQQKIGFKSSKANGEAAAMSVEADLKAGTFHFSDDGKDPGNRIYVDTGAVSGTPVFQVNLSSGATLKFEGNNGFLKLPGSLQIDTGNRLVINSPLIVFNLNTVGTFIINAGNVAINTAKDVIITAGNVIGLSAISTKVNSFLIASALRTASAVKAPVGAGYKPSVVQRPQETPVIESSNSPDVNMVGPQYSVV